MKKTFAVTGGAGFIGSHIVDALVERGDRVIVIDNLSSGDPKNLNPQAVFHKLDICNADQLARILGDVDGIFHCAAIVSVQYSLEYPDETERVNVGGTQNLIEFALMQRNKTQKIPKIIFSSSAAVYGSTEAGAVSEDHALNPQSPYGSHKLRSEIMLQKESALASVRLRYFNVYGPRQRGDSPYAGVIARFMEMKSQEKPLTIFGDGSQTRDFVFVGDIVRANLIAMDSSIINDVFNIGSGKGTSVKELAHLISNEISYAPPRIEPQHSLANISKAERLLGWVPEVDLNQGLQKMPKSL